MDYSIKPDAIIKPVQSGQTLINDIAQTQLQQGQVAIWWFGQSGYAIKTASILFYVDLYLSEHLTHKYATTPKPHVRMTHAPLQGADLRDVDWIFSSHKHSDHLDPGSLPVIFENNPQAHLILPAANVDHAHALGLDRDRFIPTTGDETLTIGPMTVHVIPSAHPALDYDEAAGYPFVGFVFEVDGLSLYHSGDTIVYDGLAQRLRSFNLDLAFLPINGTDTRRGELQVPPNMNSDEALGLAREIGRPLIIPHHYDMFTFNTVDVSQFATAAQSAGQAHAVLQCGEKFIYSPG